LNDSIFGGLDQDTLVQFEVTAFELQGVFWTQLDHGVDHVFGGVFTGADEERSANGIGGRSVASVTAIPSIIAVIPSISTVAAIAGIVGCGGIIGR